MDDYLAKPVNPDQLAEVISRWVSVDFSAPASNVSEELAGDAARFDRGALLERLGGDETMIEEIIALFLQDVPEQMHSIQEAVNGGDAATAERQAHTLKVHQEISAPSACRGLPATRGSVQRRPSGGGRGNTRWGQKGI